MIALLANSDNVVYSINLKAVPDCDSGDSALYGIMSLGKSNQQNMTSILVYFET